VYKSEVRNTLPVSIKVSKFTLLQILRHISIHVPIVLEGVVLQAPLDLLPLLKHLIDGDEAGFSLDLVAFVLQDFLLFFAKLFKSRSIDRMPFASVVSPSEER